MTEQTENVFEHVQDKPWVFDNDSLEYGTPFDGVDPIHMELHVDHYLSYGQVQQIIDDPDVTICDIEPAEESLTVFLMATDPETDNYPMLAERRLSTTASERFRQHTDRGGWDNLHHWEMLQQAKENIRDAQFAADAGNTLTCEEEMADAFNYLLFAMERLMDE